MAAVAGVAAPAPATWVPPGTGAADPAGSASAEGCAGAAPVAGSGASGVRASAEVAGEVVASGSAAGADGVAGVAVCPGVTAPVPGSTEGAACCPDTGLPDAFDEESPRSDDGAGSSSGTRSALPSGSGDPGAPAGSAGVEGPVGDGVVAAPTEASLAPRAAGSPGPVACASAVARASRIGAVVTGAAVAGPALPPALSPAAEADSGADAGPIAVGAA